MDTSFFAQFTIGGVSVPDLRDQYLHWSLGTGSFSKARRRRLELGVPKNLTVTGLHGSDDYAGSNDYSLSVRRDDRISLLRITHRDADDGAVSWHNIVRLSGSSEGCRVEHAVVRSAPRGVRLIPRASSPAVVSDIIATYSRGGVTPRDLYKGNIVLSDGDDAAEFVRHVLLDRDRRVPILVVTSSARTERPVVMPRTLTAQLRGMAVVAELTTRDTTEALTDELQCEGLDRQFTCFDGGVRLYMPDISTDDALYQHPLWIRTWLLDQDDDINFRTDLLAGLVAGRIAQTTMPPDLITSIQDFDRHERRRHAAEVLAAPEPDPSASMQSLLAAATEQNAALDKALRDLSQEVEIYDESNRALVEQLADAKQRAAEMESDAQSERLKSETLRQQLEAKQQQREPTQVSPELQADIAAVLRGDLSPELILRLLAVTWPERVIVLDTALRNAKKSSSFKYPEKARDLLTRLATVYYDALGRGGDNEARKVFGKNEFAPTENDLPKDGIKRRTFPYRGKQVEMLTHLKIGVKDSAAETMRIHFHWDPKDKKIVIGHCGPHLDFD
jgi:hypothetical protein